MKSLTSVSTLVALAIALSTSAFAQETKSAKELPMNSRVDSIDAAAKSWIQKTKEGKEVKHVLGSTAEIKNNGADAKFEDIKVGDTVAGLRLKKSDTEYEVIKITKFGPAKKKEKGEKKADGAKPEEKK